MLDIAVISLAVFIGFILLRSRGGEGLDIKFQMAPASTSQGKKDRLVVGAAIAIMVTGVIFVFLHRQGRVHSSVVLALAVGALAALVPLLKDRKSLHKRMAKENILNIYIDAAQKHGEATESGDPKSANKHYARVVGAYKTMLKANDHSFESLLSHPDSSVRCWAATHTLPFDPDKARKTLAKIAEGKSFVASDATIVLEEYDKGALRIDGYHFNQD